MAKNKPKSVEEADDDKKGTTLVRMKKETHFRITTMAKFRGMKVSDYIEWLFGPAVDAEWATFIDEEEQAKKNRQ